MNLRRDTMMKKTGFLLLLALCLLIAGTALAGGVLDMAEEIPSPEFRQYLADNYGGGSNYVDFVHIDELNLRKSGLKDLRGLDQFQNLRVLMVDETEVETLGLSGLPHRQVISC